METMNLERVKMDEKARKELEGIEPFPTVVEALKKIAENNLFEIDPEPSLGFRDDDRDTDTHSLPTIVGPYKEDIGQLPDIDIDVLNPELSLFRITIDFRDCHLTPSGESCDACWRHSKFAKWFRADRFSKYHLLLETDLITVARFLTYYLYLFGYTEKEIKDFWLSMTIANGDPSEALLPDERVIPRALQRAIEIAGNLPVDREDHICIQLAALPPNFRHEDFEGIDDWMEFDVYYDDMDTNMHLLYINEFNPDEMDMRRSYRNSGCFTFEYCTTTGYETHDLKGWKEEDAMWLLKDYFLFLFPDVEESDIMARILYTDLHDGTDDYWQMTHCIYPDGSEDSPENLAALSEAVGKEREFQRKVRNGECPGRAESIHANELFSSEE